jgi:hypothetical protein
MELFIKDAAVDASNPMLMNPPSASLSGGASGKGPIGAAMNAFKAAIDAGEPSKTGSGFDLFCLKFANPAMFACEAGM